MFGQMIRKYNPNPEMEKALMEYHNAQREKAQKEREKAEKKSAKLVTKSK